MFVVEYKLIIMGENILPAYFMPSLTPHDLVMLMHRAFPVFMSGCRSIHGAFFVDSRKVRIDCLSEISKLHR
jgi:hypothetical protein